MKNAGCGLPGTMFHWDDPERQVHINTNIGKNSYLFA